MKIVITSDAHRNSLALKEVAIMEGADIYLDAGDSEMAKEDILPFVSVKGNCDYIDYPSERIISAENEMIYITHGYPFSLDYYITRAKQKGCNILVTGHTHKFVNRFSDGILILNPGSISRPRDGIYPTYMVLDVTKDGVKVKKEEVKF